MITLTQKEGNALEVYDKDDSLVAPKMKGIVKGIKLKEIEEIYDLLKYQW